jgi:hypothetical protein
MIKIKKALRITDASTNMDGLEVKYEKDGQELIMCFTSAEEALKDNNFEKAIKEHCDKIDNEKLHPVQEKKKEVKELAEFKDKVI